MLTKKPNPLSLTQSENNSSVASFDKILNDKNIYLLEFSNIFGVI